jgi:hypothetical protein
MLYSVLCYHCEDTVGSWSKEQDDAVMTKLIAVQDKLAKRGRLGPVARLGATKSAKTLWKDRQPHLVTDGPYAETKEAILGFYVIDCETEEEALAFVRELGEANPGGAYELRPIFYFTPGTALFQPETVTG